MVGIQRRHHGLPVKQIGTPICVPARGYLFELLTKLSTTVFCSKRLMHFQTLLNIYKFADSTTFRFVLLSVHQVKGDFILILALASNHLSVCVCQPLQLRVLNAGGWRGHVRLHPTMLLT